MNMPTNSLEATPVEPSVSVGRHNAKLGDSVEFRDKWEQTLRGTVVRSVFYAWASMAGHLAVYVPSNGRVYQLERYGSLRILDRSGRKARFEADKRDNRQNYIQHEVWRKRLAVDSEACSFDWLEIEGFHAVETNWED